MISQVVMTSNFINNVGVIQRIRMRQIPMISITDHKFSHLCDRVKMPQSNVVYLVNKPLVRQLIVAHDAILHWFGENSP